MSRYIDADALINKLDERCDAICQWAKKEREVMCGACPLATAFDVVEDFPTADVVEVVRCRDCVYYRCLTIMGSMPRMMCSVFNWQSTEDDFCSFAERIGDIT